MTATAAYTQDERACGRVIELLEAGATRADIWPADKCAALTAAAAGLLEERRRTLLAADRRKARAHARVASHVWPRTRGTHPPTHARHTPTHRRADVGRARD